MQRWCKGFWVLWLISRTPSRVCWDYVQISRFFCNMHGPLHHSLYLCDVGNFLVGNPEMYQYIGIPLPQLKNSHTRTHTVTTERTDIAYSSSMVIKASEKKRSESPTQPPAAGNERFFG